MTTTYYMRQLAEYPVEGWCRYCMVPSLVRLVYEFTADPERAPQSLLTPVVCTDCGVRYE